MKISIAISILILLLAAVIGLNDRQKLYEIRAGHAKRLAEAAKLGITTDTGAAAGSRQVTKRTREDKVADAKSAAREIIAYVLELEKYRKEGGQLDKEMRKRSIQIMERMLSLDSSQIKILIAEFHANTEMDANARNGMVAFAIMTLADDHPEAALSIITESGDLLKNSSMGKHLIPSTLENLAGTDPDAALEWIRENGKKHPDLISDEAKAGLVQGTAVHDMKRGFQLIGELALENPDDALTWMAWGAKTPAERTQFLGLLREYSEAGKEKGRDSGVRPLNAIADGIAEDGFEAGSKWISDNKLTPAEVDVIAQSIGNSAPSSEKGRWLEWMGANLSEEPRERLISSNVTDWTKKDHRAAGEWLAALPDGPAKPPAVAAFAKAVAPYDAEIAAQWAMTLPPGKQRNSVIQEVERIRAQEKSAK